MRCIFCCARLLKRPRRVRVYAVQSAWRLGALLAALEALLLARPSLVACVVYAVYAGCPYLPLARGGTLQLRLGLRYLGCSWFALVGALVTVLSVARTVGCCRSLSVPVGGGRSQRAARVRWRAHGGACILFYPLRVMVVRVRRDV